MLLDCGTASTFEGAIGGVVATTTWTKFELPEDPPSLVAVTAYQVRVVRGQPGVVIAGRVGRQVGDDAPIRAATGALDLEAVLDRGVAGPRQVHGGAAGRGRREVRRCGRRSGAVDVRRTGVAERVEGEHAIADLPVVTGVLVVNEGGRVRARRAR